MRVVIPSALRSYAQHAEVEAEGETLRAALLSLDTLYPGIRFRMIDEQDRIRPHIRFFVNGTQVRSLGHTLSNADELVIVQALSGG